jgi:putative membrane protein
MAEKRAQAAAEADRKVARDAERVSESAEHLERSAGAVRRSADLQLESAERRTELAADRNVLAAERTYAAWVRTGLAALASGVGARALLGTLLPEWLARLTGTVLVAFSVFCFVAAVWRELNPGAPPPRPDTRRLPAPLLIAVNGFLVLVGIAAMVAVWFERA